MNAGTMMVWRYIHFNDVYGFWNEKLAGSFDLGKYFLSGFEKFIFLPAIIF